MCTHTSYIRAHNTFTHIHAIHSHTHTHIYRYTRHTLTHTHIIHSHTKSHITHTLVIHSHIHTFLSLTPPPHTHRLIIHSQYLKTDPPKDYYKRLGSRHHFFCCEMKKQRLENWLELACFLLFQRSWVWIPGLTTGSPLPVTLDPGHPTPSFGLLEYSHAHDTQENCVQTHKKIQSNKKLGWASLASFLITMDIENRRNEILRRNINTISYYRNVSKYCKSTSSISERKRTRIMHKSPWQVLR